MTDGRQETLERLHRRVEQLSRELAEVRRQLVQLQAADGGDGAGVAKEGRRQAGSRRCQIRG